MSTLDNFFNLFQEPSRPVSVDVTVRPSDTFADLTDSEKFLVVISTVKLQENFLGEFKDKFPFLRDKTDYQISHKVYDRGYDFLTQINPDNLTPEDIYQEYTTPEDILKSLNTLLEFFIFLEEYEKCTLIKKFLEKFEK